jgi:hypothetical protein
MSSALPPAIHGLGMSKEAFTGKTRGIGGQSKSKANEEGGCTFLRQLPSMAA